MSTIYSQNLFSLLDGAGDGSKSTKAAKKKGKSAAAPPPTDKPKAVSFADGEAPVKSASKKSKKKKVSAAGSQSADAPAATNDESVALDGQISVPEDTLAEAPAAQPQPEPSVEDDHDEPEVEPKAAAPVYVEPKAPAPAPAPALAPAPAPALAPAPAPAPAPVPVKEREAAKEASPAVPVQRNGAKPEAAKPAADQTKQAAAKKGQVKASPGGPLQVQSRPAPPAPAPLEAAPRAPSASVDTPTVQEFARQLEAEAATAVTSADRLAMWHGWESLLRKPETGEGSLLYFDEKDRVNVPFRMVLLRSRAIQIAVESMVIQPPFSDSEAELASALRGVFQQVMAGDVHTHAGLLDGLFSVIRQVQTFASVPKPVATSMSASVAAFTANVSTQTSFFRQIAQIDATIRQEEEQLAALQGADRSATGTAVISKAASITRRILDLANEKLREFDKRQTVFKRDERVRRLFAHVDSDLKSLISKTEGTIASLHAQREQVLRVKDDIAQRSHGESSVYRDTILKLIEEERVLKLRKKELEQELDRINTHLGAVSDRRRRLEDEDKKSNVEHYERVQSLEQEDAQTYENIQGSQQERATLSQVYSFVEHAFQTLLEIIEGTSAPFAAAAESVPLQYLNAVARHVFAQSEVIRNSKATLQFCTAKLGPMRAEAKEMLERGLSDVAADLSRSISRLEEMASTSAREALAARADVNEIPEVLVRLDEGQDNEEYKALRERVSQLFLQVEQDYQELADINAGAFGAPPEPPKPVPVKPAPTASKGVAAAKKAVSRPSPAPAAPAPPKAAPPADPTWTSSNGGGLEFFGINTGSVASGAGTDFFTSWATSATGNGTGDDSGAADSDDGFQTKRRRNKPKQKAASDAAGAAPSPPGAVKTTPPSRGPAPAPRKA